ncbi:MAG: hypothetical protein HY560_00900 [Gemmatimonadetes bacterium]|nr:hypothetical protein [Gemmatimonadota bacterium]
MATGSGFFLVDRNNLGKRTLNEVQQFASPYGKNYKFTEEYPVQRYSILKGEEEFADQNEETSLFEVGSPLEPKPMPVVYNPNAPIERFDFSAGT